MGGNSDSDEFEDDDAGEIGAETDIDLDRVIRDMDIAKRRAPKGVGEPAWRRLEQRLEQKQTAELISDFEDYEVDDGGTPRAHPGSGAGAGAGRKARRQR
ncbi:MAG: hypothetical protein U1F06_08825 [Steroidobacteraceae bacterium]